MKRNGDYYTFKPTYGFGTYLHEGITRVSIAYTSEVLYDKYLYKIISDEEILYTKGYSVHRIDGPAVMRNNKLKAEGFTNLWFLNGLEYSKEEWFNKLTIKQRAVALANPENF